MTLYCKGIDGMEENYQIEIECRAADYTEHDIDAIQKSFNDIAPTRMIPHFIPEAGGIAEIWISLGPLVTGYILGGIIGNRSDALLLHLVEKIKNLSKYKLYKRVEDVKKINNDITTTHFNPVTCYIQFTLKDNIQITINLRINEDNCFDKIYNDTMIVLQNLGNILKMFTQLKAVEYPIVHGDIRVVYDNNLIRVTMSDHSYVDMDIKSTKNSNDLYQNNIINDNDTELLRKLIIE